MMWQLRLNRDRGTPRQRRTAFSSGSEQIYAPPPWTRRTSKADFARLIRNESGRDLLWIKRAAKCRLRLIITPIAFCRLRISPRRR